MASQSSRTTPAYLNKNKSRKILIQGNTDERGGTEYNLALGQKRAEAVRKAMGSLGVAESQMEAVSLGEEKPKAMGTTKRHGLKTAAPTSSINRLA